MKRLKQLCIGCVLVCISSTLCGAVYEKDNRVGINTSDPGAELDVNGVIKTDSIRTDQSFEWTGTSERMKGLQVTYIDFKDSRLWGVIEVSISGGYDYRRTTGEIIKRFNIGHNIGNNRPVDSETSTAFGDIVQNFKIGEFEVDSNGYGRIPIYHIIDPENKVVVKVRGILAGGDDLIKKIVKNIYLTTPVSIPENTNVSQSSVNFGTWTNVGIGTTTPTKQLHIKGSNDYSQAIIEGGKSAGLHLKPTNATDRAVLVGGSDGGFSIQKWKDDYNWVQTWVKISNEGHFGLGTSSPDGKFHIHSASAGTIIADPNANDLVIENNGSTGLSLLSPNTASQYIVFGDADDSDSGYIQYSHSSDYMKFVVNTSERMRIDSAGNVGIGTTSPEWKLDINGSLYGGGKGIYRNTYSVPTLTSVPILWKDGVSTLSSNYIYKVYANTVSTGTQSGCFYIVKRTGSEWSAKLISQAGNISNHPLISINNNTIEVSHSHSRTYPVSVGVESIYTGEDATNWHILGSDYMWVRDQNNLYYSDGNVGIGTTTPSKKLEVMGISQTGVASGIMALQIPGTIGNRGGLQFSSEGPLGGLTAEVVKSGAYPNSEGRVDLWVQKNHESIIGLSLNSSGNVGIGTTTPSTLLEVAGDVVSKGFELNGKYKATNAVPGTGIFSTSASHPDGYGSLIVSSRTTAARPIIFSVNTEEKMRIDMAGRVGIGTTNPVSKLDINISTNARAYFSDNIGEVGAGNFAMQVVNSDGSSLKPLGFRAEDVRFATGALERMRINSTGNVGIGTNTPSSIVEISQKEGPTLKLTNSTFTTTTDDLVGAIDFISVDNTATQRNLPRGYIRNYIAGSTGTGGYLTLGTASTGSSGVSERLRIDSVGNVGIGTTTPTEKLDVNGNVKVKGTIYSEDWILGSDKWADFVFDEHYELLPLRELKLYVEAHKHLPNIPSEEEVLNEGVSIKDMQVNLLQKVEELTLYLFQQQSQIDELTEKNKELEQRLKALEL